MTTTRLAYDTLKARLGHIKAKSALSEGWADSSEPNLDAFWENADPSRMTVIDTLEPLSSLSAATPTSNSLLGWITTPPTPSFSSTPFQNQPRAPKTSTGEITSPASMQLPVTPADPQIPEILAPI